MEIKLMPDGKDLLMRALAGVADVSFTHLQIGNGTDAGESATSLSSAQLTAAFASATIGENFVTLVSEFNNSEVQAGFRTTEIGVLARDPDDAEAEILYGYAYVDDDEADYVPASTEYSLEMHMDVLVYIGEAENVSAELSQALSYPSRAEFNAHLADQTNPHNVTKDQVGLGLVPNVATNDQTPTYSEAASPSSMTSGEKLSAAFGKIAAAVTALINHIANKNNPHKVTAAQAGAAPTSHKHAATDITSGTLPVARGGTGVASLAALLTALTEARNVVLSNAKYIVAKDTSGNNHAIAGINSSNEVFLGADPTDTLSGKPTHVHSSGQLCFRAYSGGTLDSGETNTLTDSTNKLYWYLQLSAGGYFYPDSNGGNHRTGKVNLGSSSRRWNNVYCVATNTSSDRKRKDVLGDISCAKDLLLGLEPVEFTLKDDAGKRPRWGFIAQDVYALAKELGLENAGLYSAGYSVPGKEEDGSDDEEHTNIPDEEIEAMDDADLDWGLDYIQLIAPMVKVIQEQERRIEELETIIKGKEG